MHVLETRSEGDRRILALAGELTIYAAADLKRDLEAALEEGDLELDLGGVEEADTAGIQLLLWLKGEAHAKGRNLVYSRHAPAVVEVMDLLGLAGQFGDPILIAPTPGG
jgi:anti-sigma B factor antagonist